MGEEKRRLWGGEYVVRRRHRKRQYKEREETASLSSDLSPPLPYCHLPISACTHGVIVLAFSYAFFGPYACTFDRVVCIHQCMYITFTPLLSLCSAFNNRALCYHNLGLKEEALRDYNRAERGGHPDLVCVKVNRAHLYMQMGRCYLGMGALCGSVCEVVYVMCCVS